MSSPSNFGFLAHHSPLLAELSATADRQLRGGKIRTAKVGSGSEAAVAGATANVRFESGPDQ